ncbi:cytochrome c [Tenacibaculum sp. UWU-22]|uniref:c-type cytochrome n=1 Tax=Tenacibaculum sp. UWU-22 TaxID=3234187 RepID=UPI0034DB22C5
MKFKVVTVTVLALSIFMYSCGSDNGKKEKNKTTETKKEVKKEEVNADPMQDKGVGPIKNVTLGDIDKALAEKGKDLFTIKCSACHKMDKRYIGPALKGVTKKQSPEWIMNMILNPEVMIQKNKTAKKLLQEYSAPMANQQVTKEEARALLEYLRTKN